ncbi:MAG: hypothetical protein MJY83_01875 [Bacteroidales bacterium]|nr:hypothetical protein [Bacteroidales bacterium]
MRKTFIIAVAMTLCLSSVCFGQVKRQKSLASDKNYAFTTLLNSPEITENSVIFRVLAPNAKRVAITGSWENFYTEQEMTKGEDGVWTYEMPLLKPDIYQYVFDIDGMVVLDPGNYSTSRDMYNYRSNLIIRGGDTDAYYSQNSTQKGKIEKVWYESKEFGALRRTTVYLPYGYDKAKKHSYPVLYLQHGGGGDEEAWQTLGRITEILDYMIENKMCKPMVVVFPNGNATENAACETALPAKFIFGMNKEFMTGAKYLSDLRGSLMPFIDANYKVKKGRAYRAVGGLSMGGGHTATLMRETPELFDYYGIFSAGAMSSGPQDAVLPLKKAGYKFLMVGCGPYDMVYDGAMNLVDALQAENMEFTYYGEELKSAHVWETWRKCIMQFLPHLF